MFELAGPDGDQCRDPSATLRDRAMAATRVSFTITDPHAQDDPLVWVNAAFTETTGYSFENAVGRNCRFLQGPDTDPQAVEQIRRSLLEEHPITTTLLNYRRDGTPFWNELSISPIRGSSGVVSHFVGVQADVTSRVEAQQARDGAVSQLALAADRLALLADFTSRMAMSQKPEQILRLLGDVLVPRAGTWCIVYTTEDAGRVTRPYLAHERSGTDPAIADVMKALRDVVPEQLQDSSPIWRVLRGDVPEVLISDYDNEPASVTGRAADDRTSLLHKLGTRSVLVVPLVARTGILGCVALIGDDSRPPLGESELGLVRDVAARAGLVLENTQLYARESAAAATLQRSLLPRLPRIDGITVAAAYIPAVDEAAVGGDWYDVFALRDEQGVGVVVGDVMGHDFDSAAQMGKLSTIVRAYSWPGSDPRTVLTAVDELLEGSEQDLLATCLYGKLVLTGQGATLRYSNAGHPPSIVRAPDGSVRTLDDGRGPMIGVSQLMVDAQRPLDAVVELPSGSTLICFTDGLTDALTAEPDLDDGVRELCRLVAELPLAATPRQLIDTLTAAAVRHNDDVAVVAIRLD